MDVMWQTACLVSNRSMVEIFSLFFNGAAMECASGYDGAEVNLTFEGLCLMAVFVWTFRGLTSVIFSFACQCPRCLQ